MRGSTWEVIACIAMKATAYSATEPTRQVSARVTGGWASCAADFNNDGFPGHLPRQRDGRAGNERLPGRSVPASLSTTATARSQSTPSPSGSPTGKWGRGVVCFDGDRDGDIDIVIANNNDSATLYRNDGGNQLNYLNVELRGRRAEYAGAGRANLPGRKWFDATQGESTTAITSYRKNPAEQHFGLNQQASVDTLRIVWPDGGETVRNNIDSNQRVTVVYPNTWSTD